MKVQNKMKIQIIDFINLIILKIKIIYQNNKNLQLFIKKIITKLFRIVIKSNNMINSVQINFTKPINILKR